MAKRTTARKPATPLLTQVLGSSDASEAHAAQLAQYDARIAELDRLLALGAAAIERRAAKKAPNPAAAGAVIDERKARLAGLIATLQRRIDAVPADGSWGEAGDLGHYVEVLEDLVNPR